MELGELIGDFFVEVAMCLPNWWAKKISVKKNFGYDLKLFFGEFLKWRNEKFGAERIGQVADLR